VRDLERKRKAPVELGRERGKPRRGAELVEPRDRLRRERKRDRARLRNQPRSYERTEAFNTPLASSAATRPFLRLREACEHGRQRESTSATAATAKIATFFIIVLGRASTKWPFDGRRSRGLGMGSARDHREWVSGGQ
jgi:hypothetical protein